MFIKYPGREPSWTTFIEPFHFSLWFSLFGLIMIIQFALLATYYLGVEKILNPNSFTIKNALFTVWGSCMYQGSAFDPKSLASKIVFWINFTFGVVLVTSYSAQLISFLSVQKFPLPFTKMEEIFNTEYKIGTRRGTAEHDSFRNAPEGSTHRRVYDEIIVNEDSLLTNSLEEGIEKAKAGKYAFVYIQESIYKINNKCELKVHSNKYDIYCVYHLVQRTSPKA